MSENQGAGRVYSMDVLKGFIILAIVIIHMIFQSQGAGGDVIGTFVADSSPVYLEIPYLGLMAFFVVAGYFYRPGRDTVSYIRKRLVQLGLPLLIGILVLPLVMMGYVAIFGVQTGFEDYLTAIGHIVNYPEWFHPIDYVEYHYNPLITGVGYYYIFVVMWSCVLFYPLASKLAGDVRKTFAAILVLLVVTAALCYGVTLPLYIHFAPIGCAFMLFGSLLGNLNASEFFEDPASLRTSKYWMVLLGSLAASIILTFVFEPGIDFHRFYFGPYSGLSVIPFYVDAVCISVFFIMLASLAGKVMPFRRVFCNLGMHTLGILLLHLFIAKVLIYPFLGIPWGKHLPTMDIGVAIALGIVTTVIAYAACIAIGRFMASRDIRL